MKKAFVTGANGFLGSLLVHRLLAEGYSVKALVRKGSDLVELTRGATDFKSELVFGDITDRKAMTEGVLLKELSQQDIVFHLAGVVAYRKSDRQLMEKVNVQGTQNVVDACARAQGPRLLHLSSVVAVGASFVPTVLDESSAYNIHHLNLGYFETKRKAEEIVRNAAVENKIQAICVNPSTIYGAGDGRKGSRKNQVKVAQGRLKFYTSGGVNVVAAEDVLDGILLALEKGKNGERYILSSENMTIQQLFQKISKAAGVKSPQHLIPNWALHTAGIIGDIGFRSGLLKSAISRENAYTATMFHWFDCKKAQSELGYRPRPADIAIENSVRWLRDNGILDDQ